VVRIHQEALKPMRPILLQKETPIQQIEKVLYDEKPVAERIGSDKINMFYQTETSIGTIDFRIPYSETAGVRFQNYEPANLLKRWILL
jgi:hypothetical protein